MKFSLPARKPFNFHSVIHSHGWYQLAPFQFDEATGTLCYVLQLASGRVIELKMSDAVDGVAVETEKLDKSERKEVADKVKWMFDLDLDFSHFYEAARREPKLAQSEAFARGRVLRSPTVFEDVIKTILTTNTLWGATKNMTRKLVNEFGALPDGRIRETRVSESSVHCGGQSRDPEGKGAGGIPRTCHPSAGCLCCKGRAGSGVT